MAETELARKELVEELSFTENYNPEAIQEQDGKTKEKLKSTRSLLQSLI